MEKSLSLDLSKVIEIFQDSSPRPCDYCKTKTTCYYRTPKGRRMVIYECMGCVEKNSNGALIKITPRVLSPRYMAENKLLPRPRFKSSPCLLQRKKRKK